MNTEKIKKVLQNRVLCTVVVCVLALLLLLVVWRVFFKQEEAATGGYQPTQREQRLALLLEEIEGVEQATVMIAEEEGAAIGAVVVIKGDLGLVTRMRVTDAAANALHIARQEILVYPADK